MTRRPPRSTLFPYTDALPIFGDRERDVQDARQRLGQQRLPAPGRAEEEDVRLLQLDVVLVRPHLHALVVVEDRRSEEHTSELQSHVNLVCRLLLEKKKKKIHP